VDVTYQDKLDALIRWGFVVGERNPLINMLYPGEFMVAESHEQSDLPTQDGANGPWCIVGEDLPALVNEAWGNWVDEYEPASSGRCP
jgi:hypothetical protein